MRFAMPCLHARWLDYRQAIGLDGFASRISLPDLQLALRGLAKTSWHTEIPNRISSPVTPARSDPFRALRCEIYCAASGTSKVTLNPPRSTLISAVPLLLAELIKFIKCALDRGD